MSRMARTLVVDIHQLAPHFSPFFFSACYDIRPYLRQIGLYPLKSVAKEWKKGCEKREKRNLQNHFFDCTKMLSPRCDSSEGSFEQQRGLAIEITSPRLFS